MNSICALVSDLDGTLLDLDHSVPAEYDDLHNLLECYGIPLIVASARPLGNIQKLFQGRPVPSGIVACDGAIIAKYASGTISDCIENVLEPVDVTTAFSAIRSTTASPILFLTRADDFSVVISKRDPLLIEGVTNSDPTRPIVVMDDSAIAALQNSAAVRAVSAFGDHATIETTKRCVASMMSSGSNARIYSYEETRFGENRYAWLDVVSAITRKEDAIAALLRLLGITEGGFIACGNGENDVKMLAHAHLPLCPANAVANVRSICQSTTAPCNEGSAFVQWVFERVSLALRGE